RVLCRDVQNLFSDTIGAPRHTTDDTRAPEHLHTEIDAMLNVLTAMKNVKEAFPELQTPLTVSQFCQLTGSSRRAVYQAIHDGRLKAIKVSPRRWHIPQSEARRWCGQGET